MVIIMVEVKHISELKIERDNKGNHVIHGPGKMSGEEMHDLAKKAVLNGELDIKLPFSVGSKFKCTKNQDLADKCLGLKNGIREGTIQPVIKPKSIKETKKFDIEVEKKETQSKINELIQNYVKKV